MRTEVKVSQRHCAFPVKTLPQRHVCLSTPRTTANRLLLSWLLASIKLATMDNTRNRCTMTKNYLLEGLDGVALNEVSFGLWNAPVDLAVQLALFRDSKVVLLTVEVVKEWVQPSCNIPPALSHQTHCCPHALFCLCFVMHDSKQKRPGSGL